VPIAEGGALRCAFPGGKRHPPNPLNLRLLQYPAALD
jgi:hypothetical protein